MSTLLAETSTWEDHQPVPAEPRTPATTSAPTSITTAGEGQPAPAKVETKVAARSRKQERRFIPEGQFLSGFCASGQADRCRRCHPVIQNGSHSPFPIMTCVCTCHLDGEAAS